MTGSRPTRMLRRRRRRQIETYKSGRRRPSAARKSSRVWVSEPEAAAAAAALQQTNPRSASEFARRARKSSATNKSTFHQFERISLEPIRGERRRSRRRALSARRVGGSDAYKSLAKLSAPFYHAN